MKHILLIISLVLLPTLVLFGQKPAISFTDVSAASGIDVSHISTAESRYIIESMSGGAAVFDCDGDGFLAPPGRGGAGTGEWMRIG